jgi:tripartite-type tricarboxylate transporter receptor subunit TctC
VKLPRRQFLQLAAGTLALPAAPRIASALDYPTRPVHIIVPYPAGGAPDISARLIGKWLSQRLGQQFIIDNRPGAGSNIGTEFVAHAPPDGYTLLLAVSGNAVDATYYANLNFSFVRDIAPVAFGGGIPFVMAVSPSFPAKSVPEFIAYAKANPGKINMASQGVATVPHLCGELLMMMTGIDLVHVPYRGNLMPDLLAGNVQLYFSPMPQAIAYVTDGRLRALAVTTPTRSAALPGVPTVGEYVPGFAVIGWFGICAPAGTPTVIIDKLNTEINASLADPDFKARNLALGVDLKAMTPSEFGEFIGDEIEKWAKAIKFAGIKAE